MIKEIEINKKFGMLFILKEVERKYKGKDSRGVDCWARQVECLCDCGNKVIREYKGIVKSTKAGKTSNCGCLNHKSKSRDLEKIEGFDLLTKEEKKEIIKDLLIKGYRNTEINTCTGVSKSQITDIRREVGLRCFKIRKEEDIVIGERRGKLKIVSLTNERTKNNQRMVVCECDCGIIKNVRYDRFMAGDIVSCGCFAKELARSIMKEKTIPQNTKHADSKRGKHKYLYDTWQGMKRRCYDTKIRSYKNYGGRGIKVYEPWINDYVAFKNWVLENLGERYTADTGRRKDNESIDRINVDEGYYPGNIRWADMATQNNNKRKKSNP